MDLLDLLSVLESSVCVRNVLDTGGDFSVDLINSWVNNSGTSMSVCIDNDHLFEKVVRIDLIPDNNIINIYVWYKVGDSFVKSHFTLDSISSFVIQ